MMSPGPPVEHLDYSKVSERLEIGRLRTRAIEYVLTLSLAVNVIPIALRSIFDFSHTIRDWGFIWTVSFLCWFCSAVAVVAAIVFILTVPKHVERFRRRRLLDTTYVIAPLALGLSAVGFGFLTWYVVQYVPPIASS